MCMGGRMGEATGEATGETTGVTSGEMTGVATGTKWKRGVVPADTKNGRGREQRCEESKDAGAQPAAIDSLSRSSAERWARVRCKQRARRQAFSAQLSLP